MRNQAITESSLKKSIYYSDRLRNEYLNTPELVVNKLRESIRISNKPNHSFSICKVEDKHGDKHRYYLDRFEEKILVRKCAKNLSKTYARNDVDRHQCVREIRAILRWKSDQDIYRIDLSNYYESIPRKVIEKHLEDNDILTNQTKQVTLKVLRKFWAVNKKGLPRGVEISNPIANAILSDLDEKIINSDNCLYYVRFVDDILLITNPEDQGKVYKLFKKNLPENIRLNTSKTQILFKRCGELCFDFLGYNFKINKRSNRYRKVDLDLSLSRRKKLKEKIYKSFQDFVKAGDFQLLKERLDYISSNRTIKRGKGKYKVGITYNNRECMRNETVQNIEAPPGVKELDSFLHAIILNNGIGSISSRLKLTKSQKKELFKISFVTRYKSKFHFNVSNEKYKILSRIWQFQSVMSIKKI